MRDFRQPSPTFSAYDPGASLATPDISTPARVTAVQLENEIRRDALETGVFIATDGRILLCRTGWRNRVGFSAGELASMRGATFSHNHPGGSAFSLEDMLLATEYELLELRAVDSRFRHIANALPQINEKIWRRAYHLQMQKIRPPVEQAVRMGHLHPADANAETLHLVWFKLSNQFGFQYTRERS